ncbi:MAG TPA: lipopolysaccharide biosynthesis protein [Vicinamibacterales bacterium]
MFAKIRELSKNMAIYGLGDVAISIVNFFLLGLYVKYLSAEDYGVLGLLGSVEVVAKIVFRFGLDGSFMRFFYDCDDEAERQQLASTIFFFLIGLNGVVLLALVALAPSLAASMFGSPENTRALRLVLLNTFAIGFTFLPFHVLRMEGRSTTFSLFTLARSTLTVVLRLALVVGLRMSVVGVVLADLIVTIALMAALVRWFAPLIRPVFSMAVLRKALAFGAPRVPHAAAQQVMAVADKPILTLFTSVQDIGVYSMAVSFGLTEKLFLSAFESAWAPFYYATMREPDAQRVFRVVTTYGVAVLALLTAGLSAVGRDAATAMTHGYFMAPDDPRWYAVGSVITWTAVGVLLQGVYLLTSIGLNITKRTQYYPIATIAAAGTNVLLNFIFIPRAGIVGAGWANAAAYGVQAALGFMFSQRFYQVSYEWARLARIAVFSIAAYLVATALPSIRLAGVGPRSWIAPLPDIVLRGATVVVVYLGLLAVTGFFGREEIEKLRRLRRIGRLRPRVARAPDTTELAGEIVSADLSMADADIEESREESRR